MHRSREISFLPYLGLIYTRPIEDTECVTPEDVSLYSLLRGFMEAPGLKDVVISHRHEALHTGDRGTHAGKRIWLRYEQG